MCAALICQYKFYLSLIGVKKLFKDFRLKLSLNILKIVIILIKYMFYISLIGVKKLFKDFRLKLSLNILKIVII